MVFHTAIIYFPYFSLSLSLSLLNSTQFSSYLFFFVPLSRGLSWIGWWKPLALLIWRQLLAPSAGAGGAMWFRIQRSTCFVFFFIGSRPLLFFFFFIHHLPCRSSFFFSRTRCRASHTNGDDGGTQSIRRVGLIFFWIMRFLFQMKKWSMRFHRS